MELEPCDVGPQESRQDGSPGDWPDHAGWGMSVTTAGRARGWGDRPCQVWEGVVQNRDGTELRGLNVFSLAFFKLFFKKILIKYRP